MSQPYICPLRHEGVIAITGPDARKFLQGQITCSLDYVTADMASLGARCDAKGRMRSSFRVLQVEDGYLLALAEDLVQVQVDDLKRYGVFSKVQITDASARWLRYGIIAPAALPLDWRERVPAAVNGVMPGPGWYLLRIEGERAELWLDTQQSAALPEILQGLTESSLSDWLLAQIKAGIGQVQAATSEHFIPQMLNLQAVGAVSFKKGCYTGQEIVARMQYLGKLKRRLFRFGWAGAVLAPGTSVFSPIHTSAVGEVVISAACSNGSECLAVLQEDAVADARLFLQDEPGQILSLLPLPYVLDAEREIQR